MDCCPDTTASTEPPGPIGCFLTDNPRRCMIHVLVGCTLKPENLAQALTVYGALISGTLKEPGCVS